MLKRDELTSFLNTYLAIDDVSDNSWNGLQFEGRDEIKKVAFAVDSGIESFLASANSQADFLITHHGHFWKGSNPSIAGWSKKRLDLLYQHQLSLYVSHLPLDRHPEVGNNAQILKLLNAEITKEFLEHKGKNIGWIGEIKKGEDLDVIVKTLNEKLKTKSIVLPFGKSHVKTIAVCTGGGDYPDFFEAMNKNVDLYITGDTSDIYTTAKDSEINVIFAGHNATETVGLKALEKVIQKEFKVETIFIDLPTGL